MFTTVCSKLGLGVSQGWAGQGGAEQSRVGLDSKHNKDSGNSVQTQDIGFRQCNSRGVLGTALIELPQLSCLQVGGPVHATQSRGKF